MTENILVTGFGPFSGHKINASWEAVKLLPDHINGFNIIKKEVPVEYDYVENNVPEFWETFNPILVLHAGVSSGADKLTIEKRAFGDGYLRKDRSGLEKSKKKACAAEENCIITGINVDEVCRSINNEKEIKTCISDNAGRYLCEFIFYTSLNIDKDRTLFVHVPPIDQPYTVEQIAEGLLDIITCCLRQIRGEVCEKYHVQTI